MSTFSIPDEYEGLRIYAGGRNYEFDGCLLEVEDEADAKRVRMFAIENPGYGIIEEDFEPAEEDPAGDPAEAGTGDDDEDDEPSDDDNEPEEPAADGDDADEPAEPEEA